MRENAQGPGLLPWQILDHPHEPLTYNSHLLVVLHIDNRLLPLASWDLALEQDINLTVG